MPSTRGNRDLSLKFDKFQEIVMLYVGIVLSYLFANCSFQMDCGNHPFCHNLFDTRDLWRPLTIYSSFLTSVDFAFQQKHSNKVDQRVSLSKRQVLTSNAINPNLSHHKMLYIHPYQIALGIVREKERFKLKFLNPGLHCLRKYVLLFQLC